MTVKFKKEKLAAVEKAVEKVRAELRNQNDEIKNGFAREKAEWQRDRKRLIQEHENVLDGIQMNSDNTKESELK